MSAEQISLCGLENQQWLQERRRGIGGSDAAAVLGFSSWKTPFAVYLDKVGESIIDHTSLAMRFGSFMEEFVRREYERETGIRTQKPVSIVEHSEHPWMIANLDALPEDFALKKFGVEFKTAALFDQSKWGQAPFGEIPDEYYCQVQHYCAVTGADWFDLAVLFGNNSLKIYKVERNEEFISQMIEAEKAFWFDHVVSKNPPPLDGSTEAQNFIRRKFPSENSPVRVATEREIEFVELLRKTRQEIADLEAVEEATRNNLAALIGEAAGIKWDGGSISYKTQKGRTTTDWKAVSIELGASQELIEKHTKTGEALRVLRTTFKK